MATMNGTGMAFPTPTSDIAVPLSDRSRFADIIGDSKGLEHAIERTPFTMRG